MSTSALYLSLKHETGFDAAAAAIFGSPQQADEALKGVTFVIAREPTHGILIEKGPPPVYAIKTRELPAWPAVVVYYTWTAGVEVKLLDIRRTIGDDGSVI